MLLRLLFGNQPHYMFLTAYKFSAHASSSESLSYESTFEIFKYKCKSKSLLLLYEFVYIIQSSISQCLFVSGTNGKNMGDLIQSTCEYLPESRSSHRRCSINKGVLKHFAKFKGKHLCQSLFFNKVVGLQRYLKRDSSRGVFLWIFQIFQEHLFNKTPPDNCLWESSVSNWFISRKFEIWLFSQ